MEKKLVILYVPAIQERYDLLVPVTLDIAALTRLLSDGVRELCGGRYMPSGQELLTLRDPELLLCPQRVLGDYGVDDGTELILF